MSLYTTPTGGSFNYIFEIRVFDVPFCYIRN
jgi:hypothetical protein